MTRVATLTEVRPRTATYPIIEIFGPVIHGKGAMIGKQTHFVRLRLIRPRLPDRDWIRRVVRCT